jgi:dUTP pyrophosphatase
MQVKVKFKKLHRDAVIPSYAKPGDAGLDLTATSHYYDPTKDVHEYGTDLAMEIPEGFVGLLFPRSSISKTSLSLTNCVGVIDSGYRGEVILKFRGHEHNRYVINDRVAQLIVMPYPKVEIEEVTELSDTVRGTGGFGSSGS